ncbi:MAG: hypothetical protein NVS3B20_10510 [Polyangiales bacterium]
MPRKAKPALATAQGTDPPSVELPSSGPPESNTVAIVEDDVIVRRLMRHSVEAAGYRVVEYECGRDIIEAAVGGYTAVCLDLGLGDMPGQHVLKHLRARDPDLPVIVVTAQRNVDTAVDAMRAGA